MEWVGDGFDLEVSSGNRESESKMFPTYCTDVGAGVAVVRNVS